MTDNKTDLLDTVLADWQRERPDLDTAPLGAVGRIINLADRLRKRVGVELEPYELSYSEFDVLATLRRSGVPYQLKPTELMQSVLLSSGAITAATDRLVRRRLVVRKPDPADGRVKSVVLTEKGFNVIESAIQARLREAGSALDALSSSEVRQLSALLRKLSRSLG